MFSQQMNFIDILRIHGLTDLVPSSRDTCWIVGGSLQTNPAPTEITGAVVQFIYSGSSLCYNLVCWAQQIWHENQPREKRMSMDDQQLNFNTLPLLLLTILKWYFLALPVA